jgi:succinyl-diaminopimelate desuccinylase
VVSTTGRRAHAARPWLGSNAIHAAGEVLARLSEHPDRTVDLEGCQYREALSAVRIAGGVAGNVIPDRCDVEVNFRYAPDRTLDQAKGYLRQMFADYAVEVVDGAPAASPGLSAPAAADFVTAIGLAPMAKLGWTDVARFAALGIPAINFGPGDPRFAHTQDEQVEISKIKQSVELLRRWLTV